MTSDEPRQQPALTTDQLWYARLVQAYLTAPPERRQALGRLMDQARLMTFDRGGRRDD